MNDTKTLQGMLISLCNEHNLAYNSKEIPIKIGPDCYLFHATHLTYECRTAGYCKEERYFALTGGEKVVILNKDMMRVE